MCFPHTHLPTTPCAFLLTYDLKMSMLKDVHLKLSMPRTVSLVPVHALLSYSEWALQVTPLQGEQRWGKQPAPLPSLLAVGETSLSTLSYSSCAFGICNH